jgi:hypothetical protein
MGYAHHWLETTGKSKSFAETIRGNAPPVIEASKYNLDFNTKGRNVKLGEEVTDTVTIEAKCKLV